MPQLLAPALIGRYLATQWRRAYGLNISRLDDQLFVGGEFPLEQWPMLHAAGIRAVLSLQAEREDAFCTPLPARTLCLAVNDFHPPSIAQLEQAVAFLHESRQRNEPTLIHCHAGVGRAPLTTIAFLMAEGVNTAEAQRRVFQARPIMRLNRRQRARLVEWERVVQAKH